MSPTERVGPGVISVTAPNPGPLTLEGTRTWVIGVERLAVIDPGPDDPSHLALVEAATAGRTVVAVCLTHSHADHAAAVRAGSVSWGPVRASARTLARLGVKGTPLEDGDEVDLGDGPDGPESLRALATPGHSGDHLAFLYRPARDLLTGDLVLGRGSSMVAHPDGSVSAYLASLARLSALRPARLLPGHGSVIDDPERVLAGYAAHRRERTEQLRGALETGARDLDGLVATVYGELPPGVRDAAELSLLAHLRHLEELGYDVPRISGVEEPS
ncbi:MAG: MBL fold metallo-hydrolase [Gemmatimonadota bacterium]|nr:MBL fold metallo-hydrolase [Gemmatimonadota bacterium]